MSSRPVAIVPLDFVDEAGNRVVTLFTPSSALRLECNENLSVRTWIAGDLVFELGRIDASQVSQIRRIEGLSQLAELQRLWIGMLKGLAPLNTWPNIEPVLRGLKELGVAPCALPLPCDVERVAVIGEPPELLTPLAGAPAPAVDAEDENDSDSMRIQQWLLDEIEQSAQEEDSLDPLALSTRMVSLLNMVTNPTASGAAGAGVSLGSQIGAPASGAAGTAASPPRTSLTGTTIPGWVGGGVLGARSASANSGGGARRLDVASATAPVFVPRNNARSPPTVHGFGRGKPTASRAASASDPWERDTMLGVTNNRPSRTLFVGDVENVTYDDLRARFEEFGRVESVRVMPERRCAFVNFVDIDSAVAARVALRRVEIAGDQIKVKFRRVPVAPPPSISAPPRPLTLTPPRAEMQQSVRDDRRFSEDARALSLSSSSALETRTESSSRPSSSSSGGSTPPLPVVPASTTALALLGAVVAAPSGEISDPSVFVLNPPARALWIGNVSDSVAEADLALIFRRFGAIESIRTVRARTCAFVNFFNQSQTAQAIAQMQGIELANHRLLLNYGKAQPEPRDVWRKLYPQTTPGDPRVRIRCGLRLCVLCRNREAALLLMPCYHAVCEPCAITLASAKNPACTFCCAPIVETAVPDFVERGDAVTNEYF